MIRFLADEDIKDQIFRGVLRRLSDLDFVRVQDVGLRTFRDDRVLEFAAQQNRVLITHDVSTMRGFATARLLAGKPMPGVFVIPQGLPIGRAIEEIVFVAECSSEEEWTNMIQYLPL